jgi:hypothetical protein
MIKKVFSILLDGWTSQEIKHVCAREMKRIGKKLLKALFFLGIWSTFEKKLAKMYEEMRRDREKYNISEDDFDLRDIDNFIKA